MAVDFEQAVQALKQRLGGQWDGAETDGRDEMERTLQDALGYSQGDAKDAIDAMIASNTLRYQRSSVSDSTQPDDLANAAAPAGIIAATPLASGGLSTGAGLPAAFVGANTGHWTIGSGELGGDVTESTGRKGQVDPT